MLGSGGDRTREISALLSRLPGASVTFVARESGWVRTDTGFLRLAADAGIEDLRAAEILLIPGGPGDAAVRNDAKTLDWVREIHAGTRFTTSVCTQLGSPPSALNSRNCVLMA